MNTFSEENKNQIPMTKDPHFIQALFRSISPTYDRANDVITLGMARLWRKSLVKWSDAKPDSRILDCATGTGDLAFEFQRHLGPQAEVIGTDFVEEMLVLARQKARILDLQTQFQWADATQLDFSDSHFNVTSIAYGIRNVYDTVKALSEMARVTKPGGKVLILETGDLKNPVLGPLIRLYFNKFVPALGGVVSGNRSAYEYLNQSSAQFPCGMDFLALMDATHRFKKLEFKSLMGGASFIYRGTVR